MLLMTSQFTEETIIDRGKDSLIWIITSKVTMASPGINKKFFTMAKAISQWSLSSSVSLLAISARIVGLVGGLRDRCTSSRGRIA
jgi:hypothetical protein